MNEVLTPVGRAVRFGVTGVVVALALAGTVVGTDDDFPFGPFSMYAGVNPPDEPAPDTRVELVGPDGAPVPLTERNSGIRRAEIEGQQGQFRADPSRLSRVADAYRERNPGTARPVEVRIVVRWHEIRASRPTGRWHDETIVSWRP